MENWCTCWSLFCGLFFPPDRCFDYNYVDMVIEDGSVERKEKRSTIVRKLSIPVFRSSVFLLIIIPNFRAPLTLLFVCLDRPLHVLRKLKHKTTRHRNPTAPFSNYSARLLELLGTYASLQRLRGLKLLEGFLRRLDPRLNTFHNYCTPQLRALRGRLDRRLRQRGVWVRLAELGQAGVVHERQLHAEAVVDALLGRRPLAALALELCSAVIAEDGWGGLVFWSLTDTRLRSNRTTITYTSAGLVRADAGEA